MINKSLKGLEEIADEGGYILYTGQPWHPQLELIAKTLTNRDGNPSQHCVGPCVCLVQDTRTRP